MLLIHIKVLIITQYIDFLGLILFHKNLRPIQWDRTNKFSADFSSPWISQITSLLAAGQFTKYSTKHAHGDMY